ncbi:MAG: CpaF family protein [Clostridia bacterium]|nr:CpaF family protein [Clostridia bacterium]
MTMPYPALLEEMRTYLSSAFPGSLLSETPEEEIRSYLSFRLSEENLRAEGKSPEETADLLFRDIVLYGFLTPYLSSSDVEEININSWNDLSLIRRDGTRVKMKESFPTKEAAAEMVRRLLRPSGAVLDLAMPLSMGHLGNHIRITALRDPVLDGDTAVAASIRILHESSLTLEDLVSSGMLNGEMASLLKTFLISGVSFALSGSTGSGKTTLLNALLRDVPETYRIFTIESGSRELSLKKEKDGHALNEVIHTLSRPSEEKRLNVSQEDLVVSSLRFHPDIVCVGEMRDVECMAAVEASLTGHTVVSTVHSGPGRMAHTRIALLCQKRFPLPFEISLLQSAEAFPVIVYLRSFGGNARHVAEITECVTNEKGERAYRTLYRYDLAPDASSGAFTKVHGISDALSAALLGRGADRETVQRMRREDNAT